MKIFTINISSSIFEKDIQAPGESSKPPESSSNMKFFFVFLILWPAWIQSPNPYLDLKMLNQTKPFSNFVLRTFDILHVKKK